jgi:hypothetical protein
MRQSQNTDGFVASSWNIPEIHRQPETPRGCEFPAGDAPRCADCVFSDHTLPHFPTEWSAACYHYFGSLTPWRRKISAAQLHFL